MSDHGDAHAHHAESGGHVIIPPYVYFRVFGALMGLLILTLIAAMPKGLPEWLSVSIALTIAVLKAILVVLYFMHVRFSPMLVRVFSVTTLFWLGILFLLTMSDYISRAWMGGGGL